MDQKTGRILLASGAGLAAGGLGALASSTLPTRVRPYGYLGSAVLAVAGGGAVWMLTTPSRSASGGQSVGASVPVSVSGMSGTVSTASSSASRQLPSYAAAKTSATSSPSYRSTSLQLREPPHTNKIGRVSSPTSTTSNGITYAHGSGGMTLTASISQGDIIPNYPLDFYLTSTGGTGPLSWYVQMPAGLAAALGTPGNGSANGDVPQQACRIYGELTTPGSQTLTCTVTDALGQSATLNIPWNVARRSQGNGGAATGVLLEVAAPGVSGPESSAPTVFQHQAQMGSATAISQTSSQVVYHLTLTSDYPPGFLFNQNAYDSSVGLPLNTISLPENFYIAGPGGGKYIAFQGYAFIVE